jgi:hypothetical protein
MAKSVLNVITIRTKKSSFAYTLLEALRGKGASHFFYKREDGYIFSLVATEQILNFIDMFIADGTAERI